MQEVLFSESPLAHAVVPKFGLSNIDLSFIFCSGSVAPHIRSVGFEQDLMLRENVQQQHELHVKIILSN